MAKDIAALSGGDKTAFKAALAGMGYMVPIASGAISSPTLYIDLPLTAGYDLFEVRAQLKLTANSQVCGAFSANAGVAFYNDHDNFDSYRSTGLRVLGWNAGDDAPGLDVNSTDATALVSPALKAASIFTLKATIYPGAVGQYASIMAEVLVDDVVAETLGWRQTLAKLLDATGRQNLFRLMPTPDNANVAASDGTTFSAGSYSLFGMPSPA